MKPRPIVAALVLAVPLLACATPSSSAEQQQTAPKTSLLGKAEQYTQVALTAAQSFLSQPSQQAAPDKTAAAQTGVATANAQAQKQGTSLSQLEQQALLDYLKTKL